ncbi:MAG TPA: hypothetical protein VGI39_12785, partial [Polyangiaceae bacterium]
PPTRAVGDSGHPICHRVIATAEIARVIHRSHSAVREALARFKGLRCPQTCAHAWSVLSLPTGVALDGRLSVHTCFPYMYAAHEYAAAREYALEGRASNRRFTKRQGRWCRGALMVCGLPLPPRRKAK